MKFESISHLISILIDYKTQFYFQFPVRIDKFEYQIFLMTFLFETTYIIE